MNFVPHFYLERWSDGYSDRIGSEERSACDKVTKDKKTISKGGHALFPDETLTEHGGMGAPITPEAMNFLPNLPRGPYILPVFIGCVDYQFQSSPVHHQIRFVYEIFHRQGPRTRFFGVGEGVKADDLLLIRNETYDYSD